MLFANEKRKKNGEKKLKPPERNFWKNAFSAKNQQFLGVS